MSWWQILIEVTAGIVLIWVILVVVLWRMRPEETVLKDALRLLPDLIRLLRRLAVDRSLPPGVRIRLLLLLGYLAVPIDIVPDFIPVLGYADDAVVTALVLRSVVRRAGSEALSRHWPGTPGGLHTVERLAGLPNPDRR